VPLGVEESCRDAPTALISSYVIVGGVAAAQCIGPMGERQVTVGDTQGAHMQIGQVAARTELSIRTVRHYDDVGLVTPSARSSGGFRLYTEADVDRLLVIRRMKPLGFTLAEMKDLLAALEALDSSKAPASEHKAAVQRLREYRSKVDESADLLRRQLDYAEELASLLAERAGTKGGVRRT
jgi:MerR family copper efflux transcriptional regulator